jgi:hypothetical protein
VAPQDLREKMKECLHKRFEGKASVVFMGRLSNIINNLPDDPSGMEEGINNVRIAIKLLFDDGLSKDVHEELRLIAKYADRLE